MEKGTGLRNSERERISSRDPGRDLGLIASHCSKHKPALLKRTDSLLGEGRKSGGNQA